MIYRQQPHSDTWDALDRDVVACRRCPRLVAWREEVAHVKRRAFRDADYWGKPVPGFGDHSARFIIIGLSPGAHGSNRTGRMFTGDSSGNTLFAALHRTGFANQPTASTRDDGLVLNDTFITAVGRCVPPKNRPTSQELANCRPFLASLAKVADFRIEPVSARKPKPAAGGFLDGLEIWLPLVGLVDLAEERARLEKELKKVGGELKGLEAKLGSSGFLAMYSSSLTSATSGRLSSLFSNYM